MTDFNDTTDVLANEAATGTEPASRRKGTKAKTKNHRNRLTHSGVVAALKVNAPVTRYETDGQGMHLRIAPGDRRTGSWVYEFQSPVFHAARKHTIGRVTVHTDGTTLVGVGLQDARDALAAARNLVAAGLDPNVERDTAQAASVDAAKVAAEAAVDAKWRKDNNKAPKDSFDDATARCLAYHRALKPALYSDKTLDIWENTLAKYASPIFGNKHVGEVTPTDIALLDEHVKVEVLKNPRTRTGHHARGQVRRYVSHVFDWAFHPLQALRTAANPVFVDPTQWLGCPKPKSRAAVYNSVEEVRELVVAVRKAVPQQREWDLHGGRYPTSIVTEAVKFGLLTGQRTENIAEARFDQIDERAGTWTIHFDDMKGREALKAQDEEDKPDHVVYLSTQALAIVKHQRALHPASRYVFPGQFKARGGHMNAGSLNARLILLGFKGKQTAHGFRVTMRTAGEEFAGCNGAVLETMLNHKGAKQSIEMSEAVAKAVAKILGDIEHGGMEGVYKRKLSMEAASRVAVQQWADWLDEIARPQLQLLQAA